MDDDTFEQEMARLRVAYVERLGETRIELEQLAEAGDLDGAMRIAHRLKGTAGSYGLTTLGEQAATAEVRLRDEQDVDVKAAITQLLDAIDEVRA